MTIPHFVILSLAVLAFAAHAAPPSLTVQPLVSGLTLPTEIAQPDDGSGRLFVTEQGGVIRVIKDGQLLPTPFLDLSPANGGTVVVSAEQGLLGLAFDPAYAVNGQFYVYYTRFTSFDPGGANLIVERYTRSASNPDIADPSSASLVISIPHPSYGNHNGGKIAFGPDGYLYVGVGDGGPANDLQHAAESLTDLRGKILRIDVSGASGYTIPPSNPFVPSNAMPTPRGEIWDYGLRNPWRFSFDRSTGDLFIGDVGQNLWEEVDFEPLGIGGGRNYGWGVLEGTHCFDPPTGCSLPGATLPILEYSHASNNTLFGAVTGGYRYRGHALPGLDGFYVYGDYITGQIWAASPDSAGNWTTTQVAGLPNVFGLSTFGQDVSGELYVADQTAGTISRLTPPANTIPRASNISTRGAVGLGDDVLIGGFIIGGDRPKTVVITGIGPSLAAAGIARTLPDPRLTLVRSSDGSIVASNDDWGTGPTAARLQEAGLAPADAHESAMLVTLAPGAYTTILSGDGSPGIGIVAVYELDHPEVPLVNISTRGEVLRDEDVMIGGFVIQGAGPQRVVVTAVGPSLASAGIANPLPNPALTVVRMSDQAVVATNDDWQSSPDAATIASLGLAPGDTRESAVMLTLEPGAYTAIVQGAGGATGVGMVAVYAAP